MSTDEFALRRRAVTRSEADEYAWRVACEVERLVLNNPSLAGEDPRVLFSRLVTPELAPDYESCLRRAAFAVLLVRAMDRAEAVSPTSGDAA